MRRRALVTAFLAALAAPFAARAQTTAPPPGLAPRPAPIAPQNALEYAFVDAVENEQLRPAFRRELLISQVALALSAREPGAPPRSVELRPGMRACLIFTSAARAAAVMGGNAPILMTTGREALERVRGANVIININLTPMLVLETEDVESYLAIPAQSEPEPAAAAPAPPPTPPGLTGPTQ